MLVKLPEVLSSSSSLVTNISQDDLEKDYRDDPNGGLSSDNQTTIKRR